MTKTFSHKMPVTPHAADTAAAPMDDHARDDAWMQKIAMGDRTAFSALVGAHLGRTTRLAYRILGDSGRAEDVAQEAFIRVWKHAEKWRHSDVGGAKFTTWFYRIVLNLCIDEKRKNRFVSDENMPENMDPQRLADQAMIDRELSGRVRDALMALPDRQREAFVLCFYEEKSNKDAADIMQVSVKSVESLLVRARRTLRDKLSAERSAT